MRILEQGRHLICVPQDFNYRRDEVEFKVQEVCESCNNEEVSDGFGVGSFEKHERFVARVKVDVKQNLYAISLGEFGELTVGFLGKRSHSFVAKGAIVRRVTPYYSILGHNKVHLFSVERQMLELLLLEHLWL